MSAKLRFQTALKEAMRARDQLMVDTIRSVVSAIEYESMQKNEEQLSESAVIDILKRELKKRSEELEFAEKAGRAELIAQLGRERTILESFLPKQLSRDELSQIISALKTSDPSISMGQVMKVLKEQHQGQYDAKVASELAKQIAG